jgi:hypothetical protein
LSFLFCSLLKYLTNTLHFSVLVQTLNDTMLVNLDFLSEAPG